MKKMLFSVFTLLCATGAVAADYDIYGMQLGMTQDEIKPLIKKILKADDSDFSEKGNILTVVKGERSIVVDFVPFPAGGKKLAAGKILYRLPPTPENAQALRNEMTAKYGESVTAADTEWCKHPAKSGTLGMMKCDSYKEEVLGVSAWIDSAHLYLRGPEFHQ